RTGSPPWRKRMRFSLWKMDAWRSAARTSSCSRWAVAMPKCGTSKRRKKMQMREKSHVVKPLLGLMRPYTLQILLCVVLVMLFNGADLIKPWIMEIAVDDYLTPMIAGEPAQTGGFFLFQSLTGLGVSYFLVVVIGALASIFQS